MSESTTASVSHTPGPWELTGGNADGWEIWHEGGITIARVRWEGNARLMHAAPELLAACELAVAFHGADTEAFVARYGGGMTTRQLCDQLRAAIAKATGEQP